MKRYVAVERMPWGLVHIDAGQELTNPDPEPGPLLDILVKSGRVREMAAQEAKAMKPTAPAGARSDVRRNAYSTRDMVAGGTEESASGAAPRARRAQKDGTVGAATTADAAGITDGEVTPESAKPE